MQRRIDPLVAEIPLPPDRPPFGKTTLTLDVIDVSEITTLVFKQLQGARERHREAKTRRQRTVAAERVNHWWLLYQALLP